MRVIVDSFGGSALAIIYSFAERTVGNRYLRPGTVNE